MPNLLNVYKNNNKIKPAKKGSSGYDNPRENIDPRPVSQHSLSRVVEASEKLLCRGTGESAINSNINFTGNISADANVGVSGWFDDGTNFRITVVKGIITAIDNTSGGGHS
jgi:hypothetical protein